VTIEGASWLTATCRRVVAWDGASQVADSAGAKSPVASLVAAVILLFTILFMLPLFADLPQTTLATIVMYAAYSLIELEDLVFFYHLRAWRDLAITTACFLMTLLAGVEVRRGRQEPVDSRCD